MALDWASRWNDYAELVEALDGLDAGQRAELIRQTFDDKDDAQTFLSWLDRAESLTDRMPEPGEGLGDIDFHFEPGEQVGDWKIETSLGYGGMGEIYRVCRERNGFRQVAALKLVSSDDVLQRRRFQDERRILSSLEHAGIGRFIDGGETQDGRPYMVVEIVEGEYITDYADGRKLDGKARLLLFSELCKAVSHAHSRLILHRDIKPANVLVTQSGGVKLIDFGIGSELNDTALSHSTPLSGDYSAPELRDARAATVQTDIFSLGIVLEKLLSNNGDLPAEDVKAVINKATDPEPDERYGSVDMFQDDVRALRLGHPVSARPPTPVYLAARFVGRHTFATFASTLAVLSLVAGIIGTSFMADRARTESDAAKAALIEARQARQDQLFEAKTLRGYRYALQSLYGQDSEAGGRLPAPTIDATLADIVDEALAGNDSENDAYLIYAIGQNHLFRHDYAAAIDVFRRLDPDRIVDPVLRMEYLSDMAHTLLEIGEDESALEHARGAMSLRSSTGDTRGSGWIQDHATIASITGASHDQIRLIEILNIAISKFDPQSADTDDLSWMYNKLGTTLLQQQRYREATQAFAQSFNVSRDQKALSPNDIVRATNLAQFQIYFDRNAVDPLDYLPGYLKLQTETFDNDPERRGFILGLMAEAHLLRQDWSSAHVYAENARQVLSEHRSYRAGWYFDVSLMNIRALAGSERRDEAEDAMERLKSDIVSAYPDGPPDLLQCKVDIAASLLSETRARALEDAQDYCFKITDEMSGTRQIILTHLHQAYKT